MSDETFGGYTLDQWREMAHETHGGEVMSAYEAIERLVAERDDLRFDAAELGERAPCIVTTESWGPTMSEDD